MKELNREIDENREKAAKDLEEYTCQVNSTKSEFITIKNNFNELKDSLKVDRY